MYMKSLVSALFFVMPLLIANSAQADEYLMLNNLSPETDVADIRNLVEEHGDVRTLNCIDVKFSNQLKRSCYVLMWSIENAQSVVSALNGKNFDGKQLYAKEIYPLPCLKDLEMI